MPIIELLEKAGVDAFDIDSGCYETMDYIFPTCYTGEACMAYVCEEARKHAVAGLLYRRLPNTGWRIYASLISAMVAGRLVWGLVKFLLAGLQGTEFSLALFLSGAVTTAIPGIILQLILIPILVVVMERTNMALGV